MGYDVDNAPDHLIETVLKYVKTYGHSGVEEAIVAIQGEAAADTLEEEIDVAKRSRVVCDLHDAVGDGGKYKERVKPTDLGDGRRGSHGSAAGLGVFKEGR